jgi:hypothetical protein
VTQALAAALVGCRRAGLDALRTGFAAVADAAGLAPALALLSEWELGSYLCGGGAYLDADSLRRRVTWSEEDWPADEPQKAWLDAFLKQLSEPALRLLLARAAGRLRLPESGPSLLVVRRPARLGGDAAFSPGQKTCCSCQCTPQRRRSR